LKGGGSRPERLAGRQAMERMAMCLKEDVRFGAGRRGHREGREGKRVTRGRGRSKEKRQKKNREKKVGKPGVQRGLREGRDHGGKGGQERTRERRSPPRDLEKPPYGGGGWRRKKGIGTRDNFYLTHQGEKKCLEEKSTARWERGGGNIPPRLSSQPLGRENGFDKWGGRGRTCQLVLKKGRKSSGIGVQLRGEEEERVWRKREGRAP